MYTPFHLQSTLAVTSPVFAGPSVRRWLSLLCTPAAAMLLPQLRVSGQLSETSALQEDTQGSDLASFLLVLFWPHVCSTGTSARQEDRLTWTENAARSLAGR
jgi:hypothetical protein